LIGALLGIGLGSDFVSSTTEAVLGRTSVANASGSDLNGNVRPSRAVIANL
jgi:hypothetical protein